MTNSEFGGVYEWVDAGVSGDGIVVSPETLRKSVFVQDIGHCDEVGVVLPVGHQGVASGGDCVELIPQERWLAAGTFSWCFPGGYI